MDAPVDAVTSETIAQCEGLIRPFIRRTPVAEVDSAEFGLPGQTLTLTGNAAADRKWEKWALGIRLNGAYGLANPDTNATSNTSISGFTSQASIVLARSSTSCGGFS